MAKWKSLRIEGFHFQINENKIVMQSIDGWEKIHELTEKGFFTRQSFPQLAGHTEFTYTGSADNSDLNIWFYDRAADPLGEVIEITETDFEYALNVLPPFYRQDRINRRMFGVSEMYSSEITFWFTPERNGKYYGILSTLEVAQDKLANF
jgi:hypothetical protein